MNKKKIIQSRIPMRIEETYVPETIITCDGGGEPLGHPKIYLNVKSTGKAECPYCSRRFIWVQKS